MEKVQWKKEVMRLKAEDPATKLGEDQCPDNGGDEKGGAGKVKEPKPDSPQLLPEEVLW